MPKNSFKDTKSTQDNSPFTFHGNEANTGEANVPGKDAQVPGQDAAARAQTQDGALTDRKTRAAGKRKRWRKKAEDADGDSVFGSAAPNSSVPADGYGYRRSLFGHKDEVSAYTQQMDERHAMDRRARVVLASAVALIVCIPLFTILPTGLFGQGTSFTIARAIEGTADNITGFANWITGGPVTSGISVVFWETLAVAVAGIALALNGCVFQGALKNALAAPSTLGVISGGTLGTLIYALTFGVPASYEVVTITYASEIKAELSAMGPLEYVFATQGRVIFSLVGSFIIVGLVLIIAHIAGRGKVSKVALLIAGQVFSAVIAGVITVMRTYIMRFGTEEQATALQSIVGGSVSDIVGPFSLCCMAIPVLIGVIIIMAMRYRLNLLAFNDEETRSMGIKTTFTRNAVIIVCTILTGVVVSFLGSIGFVGFLIPHLARKIVGPDFRYLIPTSMLFGGIFLMFAYYVMNLTSIFSGSLGTLTSLVGVVFFLVVIIRERARGNAEWI